MKIQGSIRKLYMEQKEKCDRLKNIVDPMIKNRILSGWHYESRIKSDESFAIKVESGRFDNPGELEDFFACLIVVRNSTELDDAEKIILDLFNIISRRPSDPSNLRKTPEDFRYDGTRIYVRLKDDPALPPSPLSKINFEVQIKTFLMHAWDISTHDIVYKSNEPNWNISRVAFQLRAMLEHADLSIMEIKQLAENSSMKSSTKEFNLRIEVINFLKQKWPEDSLPEDLKHLADNVISLLNLFKIQLSDLEKIIEAENFAGRGTELKNLSPYGVIVKSVMNQKPDLFQTAQSNRMVKNKFLITPELESNINFTAQYNKAIIL